MSNTSHLLTKLLKEVSRSFFLTMRILPAPIRPQISLAYLLARTSDTIADTEILPVEKRLQALGEYRDFILTGKVRPLGFGEFVKNQKDSSEQRLLEQRELVLSLLHDFSPEDQQRIRDVLKIIISGQELDLQRFVAGSEKNLIALRDKEELDDYTYRVAGCVGEFWTRMSRAHLFPEATLNDQELLRNGVRFGQGLQLVNILRDLPKDLRQGRCYLPMADLQDSGLTPLDLLHPAAEARFRPVYNRYIELAETHITHGWRYTLSLPPNQLRLRLACAWPILIAAETLKKLRRENPLDATHRIKVTRPEIRRILIRSVVTLPFQKRWEQQFARILAQPAVTT